MTDNVNQLVQKYVDNIDARFAQAESYIDDMKGDAEELSSINGSIAKWNGPDHKHTELLWNAWNNDYSSALVTNVSAVVKLASLNGMKQWENTALEQSEKQLEALEPGFQALDNSINGLFSSLNTAAEGNDGVREVSEDLVQITGYLNTLFQAMNDKLQTDRYQQMMQDGNLNQSQIENYATKMVTSEENEQNDLEELVNTMQNDYTSYNTQYNHAKTDHGRYTLMEEFFDINGADERQHRDDRIMRNSCAMEEGITNAISNLTPEISSLDPEFTQIDLVLDHEMKKIEAILSDSHLTLSEKQGKILAIMMFLVTFFHLIQQESESKKAHNREEMSKAQIDASKMNMANMIMHQKVQEELEKKAKEMQMVMKYAQILLGVIFTLLAPGTGSAILMALLTILEATGALDALTNDIAKAIGGSHGQLDADIITGAMEVIVAAGGGAALDRAIGIFAASMVQTATREAMIASEDAIETTAKAAAAAAKKAGDQTAIAAASNIVKETASDAAKTAARKAARAFFSQNASNLLTMLIKRTLFKTLKSVMTQAAKEAAEGAVAASESIAKTAAYDVKSTLPLALKQSAQIAKTAANKAVANVSNKSVSSVSRSALGTFVRRTGWSALFSLGNTNLLTQIVHDIMKSKGKHLSHHEGAQIALMLIQALMQMIAMLAGSGALSQASFENSPNNMMRFASLFQGVSQGTGSVVNFETASIDNGTADATTGLQITQSIADLMQSFFSQMERDGNLERDRFLKEQQTELQNDFAMASHLYDGNQAGIQILIQQAV